MASQSAGKKPHQNQAKGTTMNLRKASQNKSGPTSPTENNTNTSAIKDTETATSWIRRTTGELGDITPEVLAEALGCLTKVNRVHDLHEGIRAVAIYLEEIGFSAGGGAEDGEVAERGEDELVTQAQMKDCVEVAVETAMERAFERAAEEFREMMRESVRGRDGATYGDIAERDSMGPGDHRTQGTTSTQELFQEQQPSLSFNDGSYASAVRQSARATVARLDPETGTALAEYLAKEEWNSKRFIIDCVPNSADPTKDLKPLEVREKVNLAIEIMQKNEDVIEDPPNATKAATISRLKQGGILVEMKTTEGAQWLISEPNRAAFEKSFGGQVKVKRRAYQLVVAFVPLPLEDLGEPERMRIWEEDNELEAGAFIGAKWMRNPLHRSLTQTTAHVTLSVAKAKIANRLIKDGLIVEGQRLKCVKLEDAVKRCYNCNDAAARHIATSCPSPTQICPNCADKHMGSQCPVKTPDLYRCASCINSGASADRCNHASWDRNCPILARERERLRASNPGMYFKFFPTSEAWTHVKKDDGWVAGGKVRRAERSGSDDDAESPRDGGNLRGTRKWGRTPDNGWDGRREAIAAGLGWGEPAMSRGGATSRSASRGRPAASQNGKGASTNGRNNSKGAASQPRNRTHQSLSKVLSQWRKTRRRKDESDSGGSNGGGDIAAEREGLVGRAERVDSASRGGGKIRRHLHPGALHRLQRIHKSTKPLDSPIPIRLHTQGRTLEKRKTQGSYVYSQKGGHRGVDAGRDAGNQGWVAVQLRARGGTLNVYNIYNDGKHGQTLELLERHWEERAEALGEVAGDWDGEEGDLWLGDFNRHHPMWDRAEDARLFTTAALKAAEQLLDLAANYNMTMALPPGIPTIRNSAGNFTRPDNVWITSEIADWVVRCEVRPEERPIKADHFPIETTLELPMERRQEPAGWNFRETDWPKFQEDLSTRLAQLPREEITSAEDLESALDRLEKGDTRDHGSSRPEEATDPYTKRWWTKELSQLRDRVRRLRRKSQKFANWTMHGVHEEVAAAEKEFERLIKKTKSEHWDEWLTAMTASTIWDAHRLTARPATDGGRTRIPALRKERGGQWISDNEGKSKLFHQAFFYEEPQGLPQRVEDEYPPAAYQMEEISDEQIRRIARQLKPYKAPGLSGISNSVLTHCADDIIPHLGPIFRATFEIRHYPQRWKRYNTVVLRKPGKTDYTIPGSYRPIALHEVFGKLLSACVKEIAEYHSEKEKLLPTRQFAKPGCTTTDSLHALVDYIKDAWNKKEEVVAVFMDVKAAYPTTVIPTLIHDMRIAGHPKELTQWMAMKLDGRETVISFDDYQSDPIPVNSGLDQGCNLSTFSYRCYTRTQIAKAEERGEMAANYADDAFCAAKGKDIEEAGRNVAKVFNGEEGPKEWADTHHATYDYDKFVAMAFTRKRIPDEANPRRTKKQGSVAIHLTDRITLQSKQSHKFLGVLLDTELRFKEHGMKAIAKGTKWMAQIRRLSNTVKGMNGDLARRLYYSVVVPSMLYAADVWCPIGIEREGKDKLRGKKESLRKLESVQRQAAIQATGALRTVPTELVLAHADMLPVGDLIKEICIRSAVRIASLPPEHPLSAAARKAMGRGRKRHASSMMDILQAARVKPRTIETIQTGAKAPTWTPPVTTVIADTKDEAKAAEGQREVDVKVYTDGSGHDGKVGAAAILVYGGREPVVARFYLGTDREHTVPEAENVGQLLGVGLISKLNAELSGAEIDLKVDCQPSIRAHSARRARPGSYIIDDAHRIIRSIQERHHGIRLQVHWIPGHCDIKWGDRVDEEAKKAAEGPERNKNHRIGILRQPKLPANRSAVKRALREDARAEYQQRFKKSARYPRIRRIDPSIPSSRYRKVTSNLTRRQKSILTQLRTGHVPLQAYLYKIGKAQTARCQGCGEEEETVSHYLRRCKTFQVQRRTLMRKIGERHYISWDVLGKPETIKPVLQYIADTRRFHATHGNVAPQDESDANLFDGWV